MFRKSAVSDAERFTEIYNQAIAAKNCTCDTEFVTVAQRREWIESHEKEPYPVFTCLLDNEIAGYTYFTPYRNGRNAVRKTVEISYYLDFAMHGQGIGSFLLEFMIKEAKKRGFIALIAILVSSNERSIALLEKYGFSEWGRMPRIVCLEDGWSDHLYYGKNLTGGF